MEQTVKGYYECAYSRFVDVVCASIHGELFNKCRDDIGREMKQQLGVIEDGGRFIGQSAGTPLTFSQRLSALLFLWPPIPVMRSVVSSSRKKKT